MKSLFRLLLLGALYLPSMDGKTVSSAASGVWSSPGMWQGGVVPGVNDTVIIASGHTVTIDSNYTAASITVKGNAVVQFDGNPAQQRRLTSNGDLTVEATGKIIPSAPFATGDATARIDVVKNLTVDGAIEYIVQGSTSGQRRIFYIMVTTNGGATGATAIQGSGTIETGNLQFNKAVATDTITIKPGIQILTDYVYIYKGTVNNTFNNIGTYIATRFDDASKFMAMPFYRSQYNAVAYLGSTDITAGVEIPDTVHTFTTQNNLKTVWLKQNLVVTTSLSLADGKVNSGKYRVKVLGSVLNSGFGGRGFVTGPLEKPIKTMADSMKTFEVGSGNGYAEVNIKFLKLNPKGSVAVTTKSAFHENAKDTLELLKRMWTFDIIDTVAFGGCEVTLRYAAEDFVNGANEKKEESVLKVATYDHMKKVWDYPTIVDRDTSGPGGTIRVVKLPALVDMVIMRDLNALSVPSISSQPLSFGLEQNFPNPFNPTTEVRYQMSEYRHVTLKIFDAIGREVATLVNEAKDEGSHSVRFDASKLSSGIYFAKLSSAGKTQVKKMSLIK